jgi:hypothetical protein
MAATNITEVSSEFITEAVGNQFYFRIIEVGSASSNQPNKRKFGISRFWYCTNLERWLPAKNNHVYLPLDCWPQFKRAVDNAHQRVLQEKNGIGHSGKNTRTSNDSAATFPTTAAAATTTVRSSDGSQEQSDTCSTTATKRKRGRPVAKSSTTQENEEIQKRTKHENNKSVKSGSKHGKDEGRETAKRQSGATEDNVSAN